MRREVSRLPLGGIITAWQDHSNQGKSSAGHCGGEASGGHAPDLRREGCGERACAGSRDPQRVRPLHCVTGDARDGYLPVKSTQGESSQPQRIPGLPICAVQPADPKALKYKEYYCLHVGMQHGFGSLRLLLYDTSAIKHNV